MRVRTGLVAAAFLAAPPAAPADSRRDAARGEWGILRIFRESGGWPFVPRFEVEDATGLVALPNRSERVPVTAWIVHEIAVDGAVGGDAP